jgi:hypothetical protein
MLGFSDGRPAGTYTEGGGWQPAEDPAERERLVRQVQEQRRNRTWSQDQIVQFGIDVRERMNRRNDESE